MFTTDHHRSIFTARRDQIHASTAQDCQLDSFQRRVTAVFASLSAASSSSSTSSELLSLSWIQNLLDSFILLQKEFDLLVVGTASWNPAASRLISDYFDRTVKALDLCNAVRDGIHHIQHRKSHLEIVAAALDSSSNPNPDRPLGQAQIRRGRRAQSRMARSSSQPSTPPRSLSSVARQLQLMAAASLSAPRASEIAAAGGMAVLVFTMSSVLAFVMWALVAAIQDRGLQQAQTHFAVPRNFAWSGSLSGLYERVVEEWRKRDQRGSSSGLLREVCSMEECGRRLVELTESYERDGGGGQRMEEEVEELKAVCAGLGEGLEGLERKVREVFHGIVKSRSEGLKLVCLNQSSSD